MFYGHSGGKDGRKDWEPLKKHLEAVAKRAAGFAKPFGAEDEARAAGLLHDLGKYSHLFTERLEGRRSRLDHWTPGAIAAIEQYRQHGLALSYVTEGHHIGLQKLGHLETGSLQRPHPDGLTYTETDPQKALAHLRDDDLELPELKGSIFNPGDQPTAPMLDLRMLFSTLVDAD
jgi:CRISPR-associated endonuclease Cas3-HD